MNANRMAAVFVGTVVAVAASLVSVQSFADQPASKTPKPATGNAAAPLRQAQHAETDEKSVPGGSVVLDARSIDDAVHTALAQQKQQYRKDHSEQTVANIVMFDDGIGAVATGMATYTELKDHQSALMVQRQARVIAFQRAKKNLATLLIGLSHDGQGNVNAMLAQRISGGSNPANLSLSAIDQIKQAASGLLKGFIVQSCNDEKDAEDAGLHLVFVTIAVTPQSLGKVAHTGPAQLTAQNLQDGLKEVLGEVKNGLVPPIGGRVLTIRSTGETAVIGFGSAIRRVHSDPAVQAQMRVDDLAVATDYATNSLCGLLIGDEVSWEGGTRVASNESLQSFKDAVADDPLKATKPAQVEQQKQQRAEFVATVERTDAYRSAVKGQIPPGTIVRTWQSDDWVYAIAIYIPSWTDAAVGLASDMRTSSLLKPYGADARQPAATGGELNAPRRSQRSPSDKAAGNNSQDSLSRE